MLLSRVVSLSEQLAQTKKRKLKVEKMAELFAEANAGERALLALTLSGLTRTSRLGVGPQQLRALSTTSAATEPSLSLLDIDRTLAEVAAVSGKGSAARRSELLRDLFARATASEQRFLAHLALGELRQGALEALVLDAVATSAGVSREKLARARALAEGLAACVEAAFHGEAALEAVQLTLFRPVLPMLAQPTPSMDEALNEGAAHVVETKLDGARVQVHKRGDEVRIYTRALNEVTTSLPEVVSLVQSFTATELVLDGETIALRPDGSPVPFQDTMRRFGRKLDVEAMRDDLPLSTFFFDCLHANGQTLVDLPLSERIVALEAAVPTAYLTPRLSRPSLERAEAFYDDVLEQGHEGVMVKDLSSLYTAGSRGASWLKLKQTHTLDLVVLAAEWGSGRRRGFLSNLHLGARDLETGELVMLGKTFKGLTDELLRFQTEALLAREVRRDEYTVYVRPELVVEIALNDVQTSPHYPAGMALRFARVKRYRPDKSVAEASGLDEVRKLHARGR